MFRLASLRLAILSATGPPDPATEPNDTHTEGASPPIINSRIVMIGKKSQANRPKGYQEQPEPTPSPTELYVEELARSMGSYAKPAAEARRIIDAATDSLTDALYEMRREGTK